MGILLQSIQRYPPEPKLYATPGRQIPTMPRKLSLGTLGDFG
jgi:hypothetical protein